MKKIAMLSLLVLSTGVQAEELASFADAVTAVSQGQRISFVLDTKQCTSSLPMPHVDAVVTPNAVVVVNNSKITASLAHFTLDSPTAPGAPVFDYMKYNVTAEGNVTMKVTIMNAVSYEKLNSFQIDCQLGKGFKIFGH